MYPLRGQAYIVHYMVSETYQIMYMYYLQ
jgi:hypothetical protein